MTTPEERAVAIVGLGAILPDAPDVAAFWDNLKSGKDSIREVPKDRWDPDFYWDPDPATPDRSYSKIGGWVRDWAFEPARWKLPIPPKVADAMDPGQKWAIVCARAALQDYGKAVDPLRTAVILGNAMAGERHLFTTLRIMFPEFAKALESARSFAELPAELRAAIERDTRVAFGSLLPGITEDTMPGELSNCLAGRVANLFDLHGPNYTVDAACASALAALNAAVDGLVEGEFDAALCGGIDRNMGVNAYVKFCKIGALSATGSRPYADGADGFVMGEGAALFVLKRLADAERDGDRVHAVVRAVGASSDGKGKGLTAPNPIGQKLAIERAWKAAGLDPRTCGMVEGHGTSTKVGDVVEVQSLIETFRASNGTGPIALGSVKSNIGHLKAAAGAAGLLKTTLALREKLIPPSLHCERTNPGIDFEHSPFRVQRELGEFRQHDGEPRRAAVSAFGFGGTNFHVVLEEHVPGRLTRKRPAPVPEVPKGTGAKAPLRGLVVAGAATASGVVSKLRQIESAAKRGEVPEQKAPGPAELRAQERVAIDFGDAKDLAEKAGKAAQALEAGDARAWKVLRNKGVFRGSGPAAKVAFLCTGQGSQYAGMLRALRELEPVVRDTFAEADAAMAALLDKPLSEYIFADPKDPKSEEALKQTAITQPAVLTVDVALARLLGEYGIKPDFAMGHSLGEYAALVCAGALPFADALEAVSARGREMTRLSVKDNGAMAAVAAPLARVEEALSKVDGYAVIANLNSRKQAVIGGETQAIEDAIQELARMGHGAVKLSVSHAFHTRIVAPASQPLRQVLQRLRLQAPRLPVIANVNGDLYPQDREAMLDLLAKQVSSPVQFVKGLETLYANGVRVFVEVGPKRALQGFVDDVLEDDVIAVSTNHPKQEDAVAFNQALAGLFAAGLGHAEAGDVLHLRGEKAAAEPVVITGAALGLPGGGPLFDDANVGRILRGEQLIDLIPARFRRAMVDKSIVRVVKGEDGSGSMQAIDDQRDVIKLAGRGAALDLAAEFGIPAERVAAFDRATSLAVGAGLEALRDAGIPLVLRWKITSRGTRLPDRFVLPEELRDDTGVIFASAFPGLDSFAQISSAYHRDRARREELVRVGRLLAACGPADAVKQQLELRAEELRGEIEREPFAFDRRFLFRVLSMGHSQFAELIGARGPNTQVNAACASTTQAVALAEDWIRAGRCRRVIVLGADDATSDNLMEWIGAGFLASGAAATDDDVETAATPFDRRRHGMIVGMGAAALVVESAEAARERGLQPIAQVLGAEVANSAYHGTRLDLEHIAGAMERLVAGVEKRTGHSRAEMARSMVFLSHETYTPARGGSASAEVHALRQVFGADAERIVVANTKGFTGHPMGVGLEDVVAVKALETGIVPPIPNFKEPDPELGQLNLSRGGLQKPDFALRLAAGFGSQLAMTLERRGPAERRAPERLGYEGRIEDRAKFDGWIARASGQAQAQLEVVRRTLRVRDAGAPAAEMKREAAPPPSPKAVAKAPQPAPAVQVAPVVKPAVAVKAAPVEAPKTVAAKAVEAAGSSDGVAEKVLEIIAAKTGYPPEMLDLDLDLEADLGVDTVKQAETFAAVREAYGIERDAQLKLRDFPTLRHVIGFVYDRKPELRAAKPAGPARAAPPAVKSEAAAVAEAPAPAVPAADAVARKVLEIIAAKTGYPPEMLDLDLDLEADLGVDTVKQAETFAAVREAYGIERDAQLKLRDFPTLRHVIGFVYGRRPDLRTQAAPAPAPAVEQPPAAPVPETRTADDEVSRKVLTILAEKTGYPPEMLDLDLDLEADLGVDTVKQAETFAAVREAYGIPRDAQLKLRDFPTVRHVIRFVHERRPGANQAAPAKRAEPEAPAQVAPAAFPRRVPTPVLRPPIALCKETGARLSRVAVVADAGGVAEALVSRLRALGSEVNVLDPESIEPGAGLDGLFWLPALDDEGALSSLTPEAWHEGVSGRVKALAGAARVLYPQLSKGRFLVAGTRMGGLLGMGPGGASAPMGGAVSGFVKALARERPEALVKVVDFEQAISAGDVAAGLIEEALRDPGAVEIGRQGAQRFSLAAREVGPVAAAPAKLGRDATFVITGAAGSIVSAITCDLATGGGTFWLVDRFPEPDLADPDLARIATDREGLKRSLIERAQARGEKVTPAAIERELSRIERLASGAQAMRAIRDAGGTAHWAQADLCRADEVEKALAGVARADVLLHCAGLEISRFLPDKPDEEFARVLDVKADGFFHVLYALRRVPIGAVVTFGSIAGRFGNAGQTDYSAANDLLAKCVAALRRERPEVQGIHLDWTAWARIGMASRGSIPKMMEVAGIEMLPPEEGLRVLRRELEAGTRGEVIAAGALGVLLEERDPEGGLDVARVDLQGRGPMLGRVAGMTLQGGLAVETTLDPASQPFLHDHQIDGTPVLPGVMGVEAFAELATLLAPGFRVAAVEKVEFLAPFKFYRGEPRTLRLTALLAEEGGALLADCALIGERQLAGQAAPQRTTHFTARVRLARKAAGPVNAKRPEPHDPAVPASDIYRVYFHGPAYQVLERAWNDNGSTVGLLPAKLPQDHAPERPLVMEPRLIELCFQTAGLREMRAKGQMGLPQHVDAVEALGDAAEARGRLEAVVVDDGAGGFDAQVIDEAGRALLRLQGYRTATLPAPLDPSFLERLATL